MKISQHHIRQIITPSLEESSTKSPVLNPKESLSHSLFAIKNITKNTHGFVDIKNLHSQYISSSKIAGLLEELHDRIAQFQHDREVFYEMVKQELTYLKEHSSCSVARLEKHVTNPKNFFSELNCVRTEYKTLNAESKKNLYNYLISEQNKESISAYNKVAHLGESNRVAMNITCFDNHPQLHNHINSDRVIHLLEPADA